MILLKEAFYKSKKLRVCVWCGEAIYPGEKYYYRVYIFDGFTTDAMHPECIKALKTSYTLHEDGFEEGQFNRGQPDETDR